MFLQFINYNVSARKITLQSGTGFYDYSFDVGTEHKERNTGRQDARGDAGHSNDPQIDIEIHLKATSH